MCRCAADSMGIKKQMALSELNVTVENRPLFPLFGPLKWWNQKRLLVMAITYYFHWHSCREFYVVGNTKV